MIFIGTRSDIDFDMYDEIWFPTKSCPGMPTGCKHYPQLGPSPAICKHFYATNNLAEFYESYRNELQSKKTMLEEVVNYCSDKLVLFVCYEKDPSDSDIYILYKSLCKITDTVEILSK